MGSKLNSGTPTPVKELSRWIRSRTVRQMLALGAFAAFVMLVLLKLFVKDTYFFFATQTAHAVGILVLIYKLTISKTCAGLSLRMQELTSIYLAMRLLLSSAYGANLHVMLDALNFVATLWVMYMIRFKLKSTYMKDLDTMPLYYVLVPCAIVALIGHPRGPHNIIAKFMWSFAMSVEAVSVLPQLRLIQNAKMIEPFTAHYVFALGVARFLSCANWILQIIETRGAYLMLVGQGHFWILFALLCEVVQTFILADFCYYYVKSVMEGQNLMKLPSMV